MALKCMQAGERLPGRHGFGACLSRSLPSALADRLRLALGSAATAVALGTGTVASATPITFAFSGAVTSSSLAGVAAGTPVSGLYTFESAAPDASPGDATEGLYFSQTAGSGWYVQIGGSVLTTQPSSFTRVSTQVFNDRVFLGAPRDGYVANGFGLAGELGSDLVIQVGNLMEPTGLLATDSLPSTPPALSSAVGQIYTGSMSPLVNFSVSLPLALSAEPFPGSILPPEGGGGSSGGGGATPPTIDPSACTGVSDPEARVVCLVNDVRDRTGLGSLSTDAALNVAADRHALDMNDNDFFSHTGSDGSQFHTRALDAGYDGTPFGELIGLGFPEADRMVQAWLDSELHRDLLLSTVADEAGVGYLADGDRYWVMLLGHAHEASVPLPGTLPLLGIALCLLLAARRRIPGALAN